ncbi:hypothetical protein R1flu_004363 [Riccia fluitans]|uniref:BTB domain-containing protein n=1 Tax=Riccia fluitans TaxID=41844 RepID=A0ABD1YQ23_9MARC
MPTELEEQRQRHSRQLCESKRELEEQRQLYDGQLCDSKRELRQQRESHEKQLNDAKGELAEQQSSSEHTREKLNERLGFLGLQDPDPSRQFLKGDLTFVVQGDGEDAIYAHRFILAGKSPVFYRMFDSVIRSLGIFFQFQLVN